MQIEGETIDYRRAGLDDIEILVGLRIRFLGELYDHPEDDETEVLRRVLRGYLSEAIPANDFIAWLAEHDGRVVGTGGMVVWQMPARYGGVESGRLGYVLNMYTIPEARGKGVCTRLLDELIREAKSLGLKYLHLHSTEDGIDIYMRAGFAEPNQIELTLRLES